MLCAEYYKHFVDFFGSKGQARRPRPVGAELRCCFSLLANSNSQLGVGGGLFLNDVSVQKNRATPYKFAQAHGSLDLSLPGTNFS